MFGSLKIDGQEKGMWWDTAWGGALSAPPAQNELIQWLYDYSGDFELLDKKQAVTVPDVVRVNVLEFSSAGEITLPHLIGSETIIDYWGTSVPTVAAGKINCTAGRIALIELSDGTYLSCVDSPPTDSSGNGNNATGVTNAVNVQDDAINKSHNLRYGFSPVLIGDGALFRDTLRPPETDSELEFWYEVKSTGTQSIGGSRVASGNNSCSIFYLNDTTIRFDFGSQQLSAVGSFPVGDVVKVIINKNNGKINGANAVTFSGAGTVSSTFNTFIGAINTGGTEVTLPTDGNIHRFIHRINGVVVDDLSTYPALLDKTHSTVTLDGVAACIGLDELFSPEADDFALSGKCYIKKTDRGFLYDARDGFQDGLLIEMVAGDALKVSVNDKIGAGEFASIAIESGEQDWTVSRVGELLTLTVNGVSSVGNIGTTSINVTNLPKLGARNFSTPTSFLKCRICSINQNGTIYDFTKETGRSTSVVDGATIVYGAGGLDAVWAFRPSDESGPVVDAKDYNLVGVRGSAEGEREHNGCEVGFRATDAWFSDPANIPNVYHNGTNPVDRYYSDMIAHPNGKYGMYQKSEKDTGTLEMCILKEDGQYPTDWAPTPAQYQQGLEYWTVCSSFTDPLVPYPINSGDGIGPDGGWYPIDGDKVYLVEDV